jgi:hypothetical protein
MRKLADRAFGHDRAQKLFKTPLPTPEPLVLLRSARVNSLAQLLADEHPQIAAVVLTQLPARVASKVIALMQPELAAELAARISELEEIPEHAVTEASESLVRALEAAGGLASSDSRAEFDGLAFSAAIVNELSSEAGTTCWVRSRSARAGRDPIREAMFTFEDLLRIATREMGNLLRSVQSETLVTALQTATPDLEHFLASLSRARRRPARRPVRGCPKRISRPPHSARSPRPRCGLRAKASSRCRSEVTVSIRPFSARSRHPRPMAARERFRPTTWSSARRRGALPAPGAAPAIDLESVRARALKTPHRGAARDRSDARQAGGAARRLRRRARANKRASPARRGRRSR